MSSLRLRLSATYVLLIVAALAALGLYVVDKAGDDIRRSQGDDLAAQARMVANLVSPILSRDAPAIELDRLAKQLGGGAGTRVTIVAADGRVLADSEADPASMENHGDRPEVREALSRGKGRSERHSATLDVSLNYVALRLDAPRGPVVVRVARPSEATEAILDDIRDSLLVAAIVVGGLAVLLGLLISASVLRPLAQVGATAARLASGDLAARVRPRPAGELGELADAFNRMAQTVEEQFVAASEQRNRLTSVLNSSPDAVIAVDRELRVLFANLAAERLLRRPGADVVGNPFVWSIADPKVVEALRRSRDRGEREVSLIERPGRQYLQAVTMPIAGGGDWAVLVVIHDLTDVRRTEMMRRDFVANVSHELRTPLAAIKSVIETLREGALREPEVARDFLARADDEVDRLIQLVEELLELSRIESGEVPLFSAPADVGALLSDIVERLRPQAERKGVDLSLRLDGDIGSFDLDAARIERAVGNLVHNAIKFTPAGGSVTLSAVREEDRLAVRVSDTGVGIAAADLPRIFERFYKADHSRASGGSGLGLAVVKHTIEAHGGSVKAESELGRGSTFSFSIPLRRP